MNILKIFIIISVNLAMLMAIETPSRCVNTSIRLYLLGKKADDGQWNTSYNLDKYSCKSTGNWNLVLHQNVTQVGNVEHFHIQGFFIENVNMTRTNDAESVSTSAVDIGSAKNSSSDPIYIVSCNDSNVNNAFKLRLVTRSEWNASLPSKEAPAYNIPVKKLHIETADKCFTRVECILMMQNYQKSHVSGGHGDIFYNFFIGGDGYIYEGIGWDRLRSETLYLKYNTDGSTVSNKQYNSMVHLMRYGLKNSKIHSEYKITGFKADETKDLVNSTDL